MMEGPQGSPPVADAARLELLRRKRPQSASSGFHLQSNRLVLCPVRLEGCSLTSDDLMDD